MDIHGGGRTLFNRSVTSWPEPDPSISSDGDSLVLGTNLGGGVIASYILVVADLVGSVGSVVTLDVFLQFPEARYVDPWQLIKRVLLSDDYSVQRSFVLIPTMGASRVAAVVKAVTGSPTHVNLHGRAINDDQAIQMIELIDGGSGGGITEEEHRLIDQWVHFDLDEDCYYEITYTGSRPIIETWWTDVGKTKKVREIVYTYSGSRPATEVRSSYDSSGALVETLTITYAYSGSRPISATYVRT